MSATSTLPSCHSTPAGVLPTFSVHSTASRFRSIATRLSVPCRLTNTRRGIRRVVQVARHRGDREAFQQLHAGGVVDVDLVAREAVHHQELAIRAERRADTDRRPACASAAPRSRDRGTASRCRRCRRPAGSCRRAAAPGGAARAAPGCGAVPSRDDMSTRLIDAPPELITKARPVAAASFAPSSSSSGSSSRPGRTRTNRMRHGSGEGCGCLRHLARVQQDRAWLGVATAHRLPVGRRHALYTRMRSRKFLHFGCARPLVVD